MLQRVLARLSVPALVACWGWFVFHFACTAIYLAPTGTLEVGLFDFVSKYMRPRFSQRWSLFAPDPDGKTRHFEVACRLQQPDGSLQETPFYDVSERFYSSPWHTRLGPDGRVHRAYLSLTAILDKGDKSFDVLRYRARQNPALQQQLQHTLENVGQWRAQYAQQMASRAASAECQRQFPEAKIAAVAAAIDIVPARPFFTGDPEPSSPLRVDLGWHPFAADLQGL
jgi:hypothetical protein